MDFPIKLLGRLERADTIHSSTLIRLIALVFLSSLGLVLGCGPGEVETPDPGPAVVTVSRPLRQQVTDYAKFTGRTAAVESVEVRARVSGYLTEVKYQPGQEVKAGQVLFKIDPVVYQAALDKAQAEITQFKAQFRNCPRNTAETAGC